MWNDALTNGAQIYAEECSNVESLFFARQSRDFDELGENLASASTEGINYTMLVQSWYNEVNNYSYTDNSCANDEGCERYRQVGSFTT